MSESTDWSKIKYFRAGNFAEDPKHANFSLFIVLDDYRALLGSALYPSPTSGSLARFSESDKGSRHYAGDNKRSDASDLFPEGDPAQAVLLALTSRLWGGVGLYLDTHYEGVPWPMLHLDLRPLGHGHSQSTTLLWIRRKQGYIYPQYEEEGGATLGYSLKTAVKMWEQRVGFQP